MQKGNIQTKLSMYFLNAFLHPFTQVQLWAWDISSLYSEQNNRKQPPQNAEASLGSRQ